VPTKAFRSSARRTNHSYARGGKWPQQIARVRLAAEPARVLRDRNDGRHAVVDRADQFVGGHGDDAERPFPFAILIAPVLPDAGDAERRAVGHGEGVQLLALVALVENIHRHDAAALGISVGEHALLGAALLG
jgi:hypothetical protein